MIIGIDASRANKPVKTGTEWYSWHVIQELKKIIPADVTVRLYTREGLRDGLDVLPPNWEERVLNWPPKYLWTIVRLSIEMMQHPPDVLFVPAHGLPLIAPKKSIAAIHDIGYERFPELYKPWQPIYHRYFLRRELKECSTIITISEFTKKEIEDVCGPVRVPIAITPLAYDTEKFFSPLPQKDSSRVRVAYDLTRPYFFFIGRLEKKKNIFGLLDAFAQFAKTNSSHDLVLVGPWGFGKEAVERRIQASLANRIHKLSWVPADDIPALMAGATALVFPTFYEGFGIPIVEAMAVGTPVITSKGGAHEEVAGGAALLVDPYNTEEIAHSLTELASNPTRVNELRARGLARAKAFSWASTAEKTWQILQHDALK